MVLTSPKKTHPSDSPLSNEAAQLLQQVQDELDFERKYKDELNLGPPPKPLDLSDFQENDPIDEFCCKIYHVNIGICSEDAQVFCPGCDDDPYCSECFRKGHNEGEYAKHVAKKMNKQ